MRNFVFVISGLLSCNAAFADWICEAYCPTGDGYRLITEHANHPVDALNAVVRTCKDTHGGRDGGRIYVRESQGMTQATVANACKQIDVTCK